MSADQKRTLLELRLMSGLSAKETAIRLNITQGDLYYYERNPGEVDLETAARIPSVYGISLADIRFKCVVS